VSEERDTRVDAYIEPLPEWQQEICQRVRSIAHAVDPEVTETIKRTVQPYFVLQGNIAALLATKDHVSVFLYDPLLDDPKGLITHGHANATGRQISIYEGDRIDGDGLAELCAQIVAHNRAGGWRRVQAAET
jgi:hypothetical protein